MGKRSCNCKKIKKKVTYLSQCSTLEQRYKTWTPSPFPRRGNNFTNIRKHDAPFFSKLDASSGYWQIKVDEEISHLLAFGNPLGHYHFERLPFGIHSARKFSRSSPARNYLDVPYSVITVRYNRGYNSMG